MTPESEPRYLQIAEALRAQIRSGRLGPDVRLPSEPALAREYGTSRPTIREALRVLQDEGLILTTQGVGSFVQRPRPVQVRSVGGQYSRHLPGQFTSPFARDAERVGRAADWTSETVQVRADGETARRLGIAVGDRVSRTSYVFISDGQPMFSSISWEPLAITGGTAIEEPEGEGLISGVIARMASIGLAINLTVEDVLIRPATVVEREKLVIPGGVAVFDIKRTYFVDDRAVETADLAIPGDRISLRYSIPVS